MTTKSIFLKSNYRLLSNLSGVYFGSPSDAIKHYDIELYSDGGNSCNTPRYKPGYTDGYSAYFTISAMACVIM